MDKQITEMTRKEIEAIPQTHGWNEDIGEFDTLVILPTKRLHDSGYRCMYFVACVKGKPVAKIGGGSDVIHLDGIGGFGKNWLDRFGTVPNKIAPSGWNIDCLPKSGLLQLFAGKLSCSSPLSSFELYTERRLSKERDVQASVATEADSSNADHPKK